MLIRVSGKMADGTPFASRVEAASAIDAVATVGAKLAEAGRSTGDVSDITGKPVREAAGVHFGTAKTAEQIATAKQKRADNKAAKVAAAAVPVIAETAVTGKGKK